MYLGKSRASDRPEQVRTALELDVQNMVVYVLSRCENWTRSVLKAGSFFMREIVEE